MLCSYGRDYVMQVNSSKEGRESSKVSQLVKALPHLFEHGDDEHKKKKHKQPPKAGSGPVCLLLLHSLTSAHM